MYACFAGSGKFAENYNIKIKKSDKKDNSKKYGEALIKAVKNNDFETVKKLVCSGFVLDIIPFNK